MTLRDIPQRGRKKIQAVGKLRGNFLAGVRPNPGSRQLEPQRHAFHQPADARDARRVVGGEGKVRACLARPIHEQPHRVIRRGTIGCIRRIGQPLDIEQVLGLQRQPLTGGH